MKYATARNRRLIQVVSKQQKAQAQAMLLDIAETDEKRMEVEAELVKFETWANKVRPFLTDPQYLKTAGYDELRLAVRILGIKVVVYPTQGDWPYRFAIDITIPEIMKKLSSITMKPCPENPAACIRLSRLASKSIIGLASGVVP